MRVVFEYILLYLMAISFIFMIRFIIEYNFDIELNGLFYGIGIAYISLSIVKIFTRENI